MLIKYSQNYSLFIYFFNSRTEALKIFCVVIPLLLDTWPDFALFHVFRVMRPHVCIDQADPLCLEHSHSAKVPSLD